jgi:hypothetical protein
MGRLAGSDVMKFSAWKLRVDKNAKASRKKMRGEITRVEDDSL